MLGTHFGIVMDHSSFGNFGNHSEIPALQSPDSTWIDLIDELIEPPIDTMMTSPTTLPFISNSNREYDTFSCQASHYESFMGASPLKRSSSSPHQEFEAFKQMHDSDFLSTTSFLNSDSFNEELAASSPSSSTSYHSNLHKVPSAPHLNFSLTSNCNLNTSTTVAAANSPNSNASLFSLSIPSLHDLKTNSLSLSTSSITLTGSSKLDQQPRLRQGNEPQVNGLQLVHMVLACAEAFAQEEFGVAKGMLLQLQQTVSPVGDSIHRVAAYFTDALHARLAGAGTHSFLALRAYDQASIEDMLAAYHILYQVCPYIKFAHFTSNQAIFEAFEGEENVHIIDLDIVQGYQWPAFMQALAARQGGPPHLRITGVGLPKEAVQETGKRLTELAESLHVPFQYHAVGERLEDLQAYMFQRRIGEALAVNAIGRLHRLLSEPTSPLPGLLNMIREQAPTIVTLVEQEASHNGSFFLGRFLEALHYYSAIFDSLDATLPQNSPERAKLEQTIFSTEITNIVACEGLERVERHEKVERWWKIMESTGFHNVPLSASAIHQSKLLLGLYPCDGYSLVEDKGCLLLGWQDRAILAASAWRC